VAGHAVPFGFFFFQNRLPPCHRSFPPYKKLIHSASDDLNMQQLILFANITDSW
jgi:hypothetical protein